MNQDHQIAAALRQLTIEARELDIGYTVPRVSRLTALQFLRDFVSCGKPVIFTDAVAHWPALRKWQNKEYLIEKSQGKLVTVSLTPNGRADCPTPLFSEKNLQDASTAAAATAAGSLSTSTYAYALPCQRETSLFSFFEVLEASEGDPLHFPAVAYMQYQNSSLTAELPELLCDVDSHLQFASEAFGTKTAAEAVPEAVNLWIGGKRSISSFHRDYYENMYAVVTGQKSFRLLPPTDGWRMQMKKFPLATWQLLPRKQSNSEICAEEQQLEGGTAAAAAAAAAAAVSAMNVNSESSSLLEEIKNGTFQMVLSSNQEDEQKKEKNAVEEHDDDALESSRDAINTVLWSSILPSPFSSSSPSLTELSTHQSNHHEAPPPPHHHHPLYSDPELPPPIEVTLCPGEVLYLPAGWWHEVHHGSCTSSSATEDTDEESDEDGSDGISIAVNYWYDQRFDMKYAYSKTMEAVAVIAGLNEAPP